MTREIVVRDLGLQLAVTAGLILLMVTIHSAGLVSISRVLHLNDERSIPNEFGLRASVLMGSYGLLLFALHFVEIFIFAVFYHLVGAMKTLEEALYYSASCYATLTLRGRTCRSAIGICCSRGPAATATRSATATASGGAGRTPSASTA